jgi:hypothetical protein
MVKSYPLTGHAGPLGCDLEAPHFLWTIGSQMAVGLSISRAGRPLPPRKIPDTHFCYRLSRTQGHSPAGRITSIEKNHLIGIPAHDLLACSSMPQSTMRSRAPLQVHRYLRLLCVHGRALVLMKTATVIDRSCVLTRSNINTCLTFDLLTAATH